MSAPTLIIAVERGRLIGDSLLLEPALSAWAERHGGRVRLYNPLPSVPLFDCHPHITITSQPEAGAIELSCWSALLWSVAHRRYFAAGYFEPLGLPLGPADRLHLRLFGPLPEVADVGIEPEHHVFIAPFSVSCMVHATGVADKTAPLAWWEPVIAESPLPVVSLGSATDPEVPGTINLRGLGLRTVAALLARARAFVTVETGLLHLAGAVCREIVYLNSATPPSLCIPPNPATHVQVIRARRPEDWQHHLVREAIDIAVSTE